MILEYRACSNCRERRMASLQKFHYRMTCDKNYMVCCNINFVLAINFESYLICVHLFTMKSSKWKCYLGSNTLYLIKNVFNYFLNSFLHLPIPLNTKALFCKVLFSWQVEWGYGEITNFSIKSAIASIKIKEFWELAKIFCNIINLKEKRQELKLLA